MQYIGNAQIGTAPAQLWGNSTFQLALSAEGCLPIFTRTATSMYAAGINTIYWGTGLTTALHLLVLSAYMLCLADVVSWLPSNWFHMPPHCQSAAPRTVESLSHTEAATLELVQNRLRRYHLDLDLDV